MIPQLYNPLALLLFCACLLTLLIRTAWGILRWYLFIRNSGIPEIEKLKDRPSRSLRRGTAVICGGRSVEYLFLCSTPALISESAWQDCLLHGYVTSFSKVSSLLNL